MPGPDLQIRGLSKVFDTAEGPITAVDDVDIEVEGDEFFSLLGPSGCGKTTTLRMIAGLESISSGEIWFRGRNLAGLPPAQRNLGMVFQSYALFPHLTVFENAAYGLKIRKTRGGETGRRVKELLDALGLEGLQGRYPADLSGGQQQRVSIARALAYEPDMFLLDEPLANLDAKLRVQMREEIRRIQKSLGVLALYVTHDQEEAMAVSDRIGVFNLGRLMQVGTPIDVYKDPHSLFVADFIGKINFFGADVSQRDGHGGSVRLEGADPVVLPRFKALDPRERERYGVQHSAVIAVRPEHLRLAAAGNVARQADPQDASARARIPGTIRRVLFLGSVTRTFVTCKAAMREVVVEDDGQNASFPEGQDVDITFAPEDAICFEGGTT